MDDNDREKFVALQKRIFRLELACTLLLLGGFLGIDRAWDSGYKKAASDFYEGDLKVERVMKNGKPKWIWKKSSKDKKGIESNDIRQPNAT